MSAPLPPPKDRTKIALSIQLTRLGDLLLGTRRLALPERESLAGDIDSLRQVLASAKLTPKEYEDLLTTLRDEVSRVEQRRTNSGSVGTASELGEVRQSLRGLREQVAGVPPAFERRIIFPNGIE